MERERYTLTFSVELGHIDESDPVVVLRMHLGLFTRVIREWEITPGQAYVYQEKPEQLADFVMDRLKALSWD